MRAREHQDPLTPGDLDAHRSAWMRIRIKIQIEVRDVGAARRAARDP
jgi:hypothetical protein